MTESSTPSTESMTARTTGWETRTTPAGQRPGSDRQSSDDQQRASLTAGARTDGSRSRGFAPNPLDHVRGAQLGSRLLVARELERLTCRAGLR